MNIQQVGSTASAILGFPKDTAITPTASSRNAEVTVDGVSYQHQGNKHLTDLIKGLDSL